MNKIKPLIWTEHMNGTLFRARSHSHVCYCIIKGDDGYHPSLVIGGNGLKVKSILFRRLGSAKNYCKRWHIKFVTEMLE